MVVAIKKIRFALLLLPTLSMVLIGCGGDKDEPMTDDGPGITPDPPKITKVEPESAARGEEVTLTGTDFSAVASENLVAFNGVQAEVKSATAIQIITTVPEGATTGPLTVTYNNQTATSTNDFEVLANVWVKKADFGGVARFAAVGFGFDDKGYIGTGEDANDTKLGDLWEYNVATDEWVQKIDFPGSARWFVEAISDGNKAFFGLGQSEVQLEQDWWEYDPMLDAWTEKEPFVFAISNKTSFQIENVIYMLPGSSTSVYAYNTSTNTWTQKNDFPGTSRGSSASFSINGKGYIGTGVAFGHNELKDFWEYDPVADTWKQVADFGGNERGYTLSFALDGKGYVGMGTGPDDINALKDFWEYDPTEDVWTKKADFGGLARGYAVGFTIGDRAYIGTGVDNDGNFLSDFWEYIPD